MNKLFLIPARGGSKSIPKKNIKNLKNKPLIYYAIDVARELSPDELICVSTDNDEIIEKVESYGLKIPFKRPDELATDQAGGYEVILHAVSFYENAGFKLDCIVLLQPTSPFRKISHVKEAMELYSNDVDMVVSVKNTKSNPYFVLYEEDKNGFLKKLNNDSSLMRRQDAPVVYELNGAVYVINNKSLKKYNSVNEFTRIIKYEMDDLHSLDMDTSIDWAFGEFLIEKDYIQI